MKLKTVWLLILSLWPAGSIFSEPPGLLWQSSNCWMNALVQVMYNMVSFIDALSGDAGAEFLRKEASGEKQVALAQSFIKLARDLKSGTSAADHYKGPLAALQAGFIAYQGSSFSGTADSLEGLGALLRGFASEVELSKFYNVAVSASGYSGELPYLYIDFTRGVSNIAAYFERGVAVVGGYDRFYGTWGEERMVRTGRYLLVGAEAGLAAPYPNGAILAKIDVGTFTAPELTEQWSAANLTSQYELTGLTLWVGGHYLAWIKDMRDGAHPWYGCDWAKVWRLRHAKRELAQQWTFSMDAWHPNVLLYEQMSKDRLQAYEAEQKQLDELEKQDTVEDEARERQLREERERQLREEKEREEHARVLKNLDKLAYALKQLS
ncbi:MAG: ubiquitin carboxyl-terminal hydrolase [Candidatus Dependentiae bacterium]|nr:ubiquitin carboxyl-terminal hydrolase [Candidatus Dependentiae bacterium]